MPTQTWRNLEAGKRELITREALIEFAQHSYAQASITALVRRLGIAKGSVYQYFTDKEDLYIMLVRVAHERVHSALRSRIPLALYHEVDVFVLLRRYFAEAVSVALDYPIESALIQRSYTDVGPASDVVRALAERIQRSFVEEIITSAVQSHTIRADVDTHVMVFVLESLFARIIPYIQTHISPHTSATEEAVKQSASQIVIFFDQLIAVLDQGLRTPQHGRK